MGLCFRTPAGHLEDALPFSCVLEGRLKAVEVLDVPLLRGLLPDVLRRGEVMGGLPTSQNSPDTSEGIFGCVSTD